MEKNGLRRWNGRKQDRKNWRRMRMSSGNREERK